MAGKRYPTHCSMLIAPKSTSGALHFESDQALKTLMLGSLLVAAFAVTSLMASLVLSLLRTSFLLPRKVHVLVIRVMALSRLNSA